MSQITLLDCVMYNTNSMFENRYNRQTKLDSLIIKTMQLLKAKGIVFIRPIKYLKNIRRQFK